MLCGFFSPGLTFEDAPASLTFFCFELSVLTIFLWNSDSREIFLEWSPPEDRDTFSSSFNTFPGVSPEESGGTSQGPAGKGLTSRGAQLVSGLWEDRKSVV